MQKLRAYPKDPHCLFKGFIKDSAPQIIVFFATVERILFRPPSKSLYAERPSLRRLPLSHMPALHGTALLLMAQRILYLNEIYITSNEQHLSRGFVGVSDNF